MTITTSMLVPGTMLFNDHISEWILIVSKVECCDDKTCNVTIMTQNCQEIKLIKLNYHNDHGSIWSWPRMLDPLP
jgi:hypothetical protein